jgi:hypothetical protein
VAVEVVRCAVLATLQDTSRESVRQLMHPGLWWLMRAFDGGSALKNRRAVGRGTHLGVAQLVTPVEQRL